MDIEPSWDLGGWLFLFINCMATSNDQTNTKSHSIVLSLFLLVTFLFLFFLLIIINPKYPTSHHQYSHKGFKDAITLSSSPSMRVLLESSIPASSTMDLQPRARTRTQHARASSSKRRDQFGADAHEVPSGPNPISN